MKFKKLFILPLVAILLIPALAFAADFKAGEEVTTTKTVNDDFYVAGGSVQVESDVNGDLMMAGGRLFVDSNILEDLMLAGGDIILQGNVGGDARLFAGNITVNAPVKDDLIIGGGNITLSNKSSVGGDLIFGGGNVMINGPVNGNVLAGGGNVYINNTIKGNVKLFDVDKLTFGPKGKIMGNLDYKSAKVAKTADKKDVDKKTVLGEIKHSPRAAVMTKKEARDVMTGLITGITIIKFLSLLFLGLFFVWGLRFYMQKGVGTSYEYPFKSFGIGFAIIILTPIVAFIFLITGIGYLVSLLLMMFWVMALICGKLMAASIIGMKIVQVKDKSGFLRTYGAFALGLLIFTALTFVPFIGWLAKFILLCIALGAMAIYETGLFAEMRKKKKI